MGAQILVRADATSQVISTRFSEVELTELLQRAEREGLDRSAAIRAAVREWAHA